MPAAFERAVVADRLNFLVAGFAKINLVTDLAVSPVAFRKKSVAAFAEKCRVAVGPFVFVAVVARRLLVAIRAFFFAKPRFHAVTFFPANIMVFRLNVLTQDFVAGRAVRRRAVLSMAGHTGVHIKRRFQVFQVFFQDISVTFRTVEVFMRGMIENEIAAIFGTSSLIFLIGFF